jgi:hypothetical protein
MSTTPPRRRGVDRRRRSCFEADQVERLADRGVGSTEPFERGEGDAAVAPFVLAVVERQEEGDGVGAGAWRVSAVCALRGRDAAGEDSDDDCLVEGQFEYRHRHCRSVVTYWSHPSENPCT